MGHLLVIAIGSLIALIFVASATAEARPGARQGDPLAGCRRKSQRALDRSHDRVHEENERVVVPDWWRANASQLSTKQSSQQTRFVIRLVAAAYSWNALT